MTSIFSNIYGACASFFSAVEHGANALDSVAKWAEEESASMEQQAAQQRIALIEDTSVGSRLITSISGTDRVENRGAALAGLASRGSLT